jgi:catechol 2,3-dioxygenase
MKSPAAAPNLAATTRLGATHLTVSDLDRSLRFYQDALGLRVHDLKDGSARLGAGGDDVLVLGEEPGARPAGRHAGLYHVALLYPSREELAFAVDRLVRTQTPVQGMSDHGTHEAIYLPDPDGNGIELAADRAREEWPEAIFTGRGPDPLDVHGLFDLVAHEPEPPAAVAPGLAVGHVHLHVGDVAAVTRFYRDVVGFELQFAMPSAAFVSAGGYHHHVAFNTWRGETVPPVPEGVVGLRRFTVVLRDAAELAALHGRVARSGVPSEQTPDGLLLRDPAGNAVLLRAAAG